MRTRTPTASTETSNTTASKRRTQARRIGKSKNNSRTKRALATTAVQKLEQNTNTTKHVQKHSCKRKPEKSDNIRKKQYAHQ